MAPKRKVCAEEEKSDEDMRDFIEEEDEEDDEDFDPDEEGESEEEEEDDDEFEEEEAAEEDAQSTGEKEALCGATTSTSKPTQVTGVPQWIDQSNIVQGKRSRRPTGKRLIDELYEEPAVQKMMLEGVGKEIHEALVDENFDEDEEEETGDEEDEEEDEEEEPTSVVPQKKAKGASKAPTTPQALESQIAV